MLGAWILLLVVLSGVAGAAGGTFKDRFELPDTETQDVIDILDEHSDGSGQGLWAGQVVVVADQGVDDPTARAAFDGLLADLQAAIPELTVDSNPFETGAERQISDDRTLAYAEVSLPQNIDSNDAYDYATDARDLREDAQAAVPEGVQLELGGDLFAEFQQGGGEMLGLVAAIFILLVAFGSLLAMGLPLLTAMFGIGSGVALIQLAANVIDMPSFTLQLVLMIGIGVGIDYALFIVTRYRQGLHEGRDPEEAVITAIDTAGRAVLFAGTTVVISVMGMVFMRLSFMTSLAFAAAFGVFMTMAASLTLLPAVLGFVGHNIDKLGLPHRHRQEGSARHSFWWRWSRVIQNRPWPVFVGAAAVLIVLALPVLGLRLGFADAGNRSEADSTRRAYDLLAAEFGPGFNGPLFVAAETPNGAADLEALGALAATLEADEGVAGVQGPFPLGDDGQAAMIQVLPSTSPQDKATSQLVHHLRDEVIPAATEGTGLDASLGAGAAVSVDFSDVIGRRLPWFIGAVLLLSFLVLMATFRSIVVPLKAVIMNLLSIGAAYGVIVAVFQWGWLSGIFGADPGPIESWAPMMLFAVVFGLSMDYEVFLLSRMREEYDRSGDNAVAVADGLAVTARVITAAAGIMVFVFGGFILSDERALQLVGLGLATAVLVDATIVRLLLVPATMELLGDRNWWFPKWLDRIIPTLHVEPPSGTTPKAPELEEPEEPEERQPQLV
ncbi:MAG: MMPL family transporter [Acidimicrobiales bacterium]